MTIGIISGLSSITITALNPTKQLLKTNDAATLVGSRFIEEGLRQAVLDTSVGWNGSVLPVGSDARVPLCAQGQMCSGGINLDSVLVPKYISMIPRDSRESDPTKSGFDVYRNEQNLPVVVPSWFSTYSTGILDTSFNTTVGPDSTVSGYVAQPDGKLIIHGSFSTFGAVSRYRLARINTDGSLDTSFDIGTGPTINSGIIDIKLLSDGKMIVIGTFTTWNGFSRNRIVRLNADGSVDTTFNPGTGANNMINNIVVQADGKIIMSGWFSAYNGVARGGVARVNTDGSLDTSYNSATGVAPAFSNINKMYLQPDGKVILMGSFTTYNGTARNRIARVNTDGSVDTTFDPGTGPNAVWSWSGVGSYLAQSDGKLIISGSFNSYNGVARNSIARINTDGSLDTTFNPGTGLDNNGGTELSTILQQPDGKFVLYGGNFNSYNGTARTYVARISANGTLDAAYANGGFSSQVSGISLQPDGKVYAWGYFTNFGSVSRYLVLRLNADGSLDTSFNPVVNNLVKGVGVLKDGRAVMYGDFTTVNGTTATRIAILK